MGSEYSFKVFRFIGVLSLAPFALVSISQSAQAGFEWIPPKEETQKAVPAPVVEKAPMAQRPAVQSSQLPPPMMKSVTPAPAEQKMQTKVISSDPAIYDGQAPLEKPEMASQLPQQITPEPTTAPVSAPPPAMAPAPQQGGKLVINPFPEQKTNVSLSTAAPAQPRPMPQGNFENAVGFGSDMPLPLALNQVVPAGYAYSFLSDVDMSADVSWEGGKPWNIVLDEMLSPLDLEAVIQGKAVVIRPKGSDRVSRAIMPQAETQPVMASAQRQPAPQAKANPMARSNITDPGPAPMTPFETVMAVEEAKAVPLSVIEPAAGNITQIWSAPAGQTARTTLENWSNTAGVHLVWESQNDFVLTQPVSVDDNLNNAIARLLSTLPQNALDAKFNVDQSVLIVKDSV